MVTPPSMRDGQRFRCAGKMPQRQMLPGHRFTYLVARRFWILDQQCGRLHDLTGLAIAALRDIEIAPCLLNRMIACRMEAFDRGDLAADDVGNRGDTGAYGLLVDKDGARAAQGLAAAKLGARSVPPHHG